MSPAVKFLNDITSGGTLSPNALKKICRGVLWFPLHYRFDTSSTSCCVMQSGFLQGVEKMIDPLCTVSFLSHKVQRNTRGMLKVLRKLALKREH
ncbi:hypothetical protein JTE90_018365 [Oedothorax gibbosus]|uniref:Uncharacterized protein n=1 Tax=Oedothorax gibbosus TaxID=931172 RepID=A0AAV6TWP6_9ARAC|nr:hypothetical protein JTE90_018365 [Oedothorax gibbosus]